MKTIITGMDTPDFHQPIAPTSDHLDWAAQHLLNGGIVGLPTETVYGLAGLTHIPQAIDAIYETKKRPRNHPLIVHIARTDHLKYFAQQDNALDRALSLAMAFWPGPLTLIVNANHRAHASQSIDNSSHTIAIRCPNHPVALALFDHIASHNTDPNRPIIGLAAPSANPFGKISPTTAHDVIDAFCGKIPTLDGGACQQGIESTIIDLTTPTPVILRPGLIDASAITSVLGIEVKYKDAIQHKTRVPGGMLAHYAPNTPIRLLHSGQFTPEIAQAIVQPTIVYSPYNISHTNNNLRWVEAPKLVQNYAQKLYQQLRQFDQMGVAEIVVILPEHLDETWFGITDRLSKAAASFI